MQAVIAEHPKVLDRLVADASPACRTRSSGCCGPASWRWWAAMLALVLLACRQPRQPDAGADGDAPARAGAARRAGRRTRRRHPPAGGRNAAARRSWRRRRGCAWASGRCRRCWRWIRPWPARLATSHLDWRVQLATAALTLTRGARGRACCRWCASCAATWRAASPTATGARPDRGATDRMRAWLVGAECALAVVLLACGALLLSGVQPRVADRSGFRSARRARRAVATLGRRRIPPKRRGPR